MASAPSLADLPTTTSITLLLRHHKSSVLLSIEPSTPFTTISELLIAALQSRHITSIASTADSGSTRLPSSPEDVELAVLTDKRDPAKGWTGVHVRQKELDAKAAGGPISSKKRAATAATGGTKKNGTAVAEADCCPESIGLGDGGWVAWRTKSKDVSANAQVGKVEQENDEENEDEGADGGDEDMDVVLDEDPGWDVVLPSYEEDDDE